MVHQEKPQQMLRLFCCTIPFGTDSHFAQALVFVSRGLVAKSRVKFPIQRNFVFRGKVDLAKQIAWCWHSV